MGRDGEEFKRSGLPYFTATELNFMQIDKCSRMSELPGKMRQKLGNGFFFSLKRSSYRGPVLRAGNETGSDRVRLASRVTR
jgi:hypothetical protein